MGFRGEASPSSPAQPDSPLRRRLLIGTSATAAVALTGNAALRELSKEPEIQEPLQFAPDEYGINLNYRNFYVYKLTPKDALPQLLRFPGNHVRVPIYLDVIFQNGSKPDFSGTDALLNRCIDANKKLHIVFGTKTTAGDEFNLSPQFYTSSPFARLPGSVIGSTKEQRDILREEVGLVAQHYLADPKYAHHIVTAHRTNEGCSKNLFGVTTRSVDPEWYVEEYELVKGLNPHGIPLVQNIPLDTPENIPLAKAYADITALNFYPQAWDYYLGVIGDTYAQAKFWNSMDEAVEDAKSNNNEPAIQDEPYDFIASEIQSAAWLNANLQQKYPYKKARVMDTLRKVKSHNPKISFLWDVEQHIKNGDMDFIDQLYGLAS